MKKSISELSYQYPLLTDDYGDEALASIKFSEEFSSRYGSPHPNFFPGTLEDAIRESCLKPPKDVSHKQFIPSMVLQLITDITVRKIYRYIDNYGYLEKRQYIRSNSVSNK